MKLFIVNKWILYYDNLGWIYPMGTLAISDDLDNNLKIEPL